MPELADHPGHPDPPEPGEPVADEVEDAVEYEYELVDEDDDALTEPVVVDGDRVTTDGGSLDRALVRAFLKPGLRRKRGGTGTEQIVVRRRRVLTPPRKKTLPPFVRLRPFVPKEPAGRAFWHATAALIAAALTAVAVLGLAPAAGDLGRLQTVAAPVSPFVPATSAAGLVIGLFLAARVVGGSFLGALATVTLAGATPLLNCAVAGEAQLPGLALATLGVGLTLGWWRSASLVVGGLAGLTLGVAVAVDERAVAGAVPLGLAAMLAWQWRRPVASLWRVMLPPGVAVVGYVATLALAGLSLEFTWRPTAVEGWDRPDLAGTLLLAAGLLGGLTMLARRPRLGVGLLAWSAASLVAWQGAWLALLPPVLVGATYALWRVLSAPGKENGGGGGREASDGGALWRQATVPLIAGGLVVAWLWLGLRPAPLAAEAERRLAAGALVAFVHEYVPADASLQLDPPGEVALPRALLDRANEGEGPRFVLTTELGRRMLASELRQVTPSPLVRVVGRLEDSTAGVDWVLVRVEAR